MCSGVVEQLVLHLCVHAASSYIVVMHAQESKLSYTRLSYTVQLGAVEQVALHTYAWCRHFEVGAGRLVVLHMCAWRSWTHRLLHV